MTDLLPVQRDELAIKSDSVAYMAMALSRAKGWLAEAEHVDDVREQKAVAVGIEAYVREKELAFDSQLSAQEIVHRCDRRIGQLLPPPVQGSHLSSLSAETMKVEDRRDARELASIPDDDFERALEEAKAEGNLSRANIVRKVKPQPEYDPNDPFYALGDCEIGIEGLIEEMGSLSQKRWDLIPGGNFDSLVADFNDAVAVFLTRINDNRKDNQ